MKLSDNIHLLEFDLSEQIRSYLYLIVDSGEAVIIDAHKGQEAEKVLEAIERIIKLDQLSTVVLTHAHFDHIGACPLIEEKTNAEFAAHIADAWFMEEPWSQFQMLYQFRNPSKEIYKETLEMVGGRGVKVTNLLRGGDVLKVGSIKLKVIHTPGHSPGSICLYEPETKTLFSGDVLIPSEWFQDRLGAVLDADYHIKSLEKLSKMDVEVLLPGHEPIRRGSDVSSEISRHMDRFKLIESTILQILSEVNGLSLSEIRERLVEHVLGPRIEDKAPPGEWWTTYVFLRKLCYEGRLVQEKGHFWRYI